MPKVLPIRFEDTYVNRIDTLAEALTTRAAGAKVSRTAVMRLAIERGLEALEAEVVGPKPKRKPRKK
jgi:predicted transcriptional regulator